MFEAHLVVTSSDLRLADLATALRRAPDIGHDIGSPNPARPGSDRNWSSWAIALKGDGDLHPGTEGLSEAIEQLGSSLADLIAKLGAQGCTVVLDLVQEFDAERSETTGLHLSRQALAWLARAGPCLDVDQYVVSDEG